MRDVLWILYRAGHQDRSLRSFCREAGTVAGLSRGTMHTVGWQTPRFATQRLRKRGLVEPHRLELTPAGAQYAAQLFGVGSAHPSVNAMLPAAVHPTPRSYPRPPVAASTPALLAGWSKLRATPAQAVQQGIYQPRCLFCGSLLKPPKPPQAMAWCLRCKEHIPY